MAAEAGPVARTPSAVSTISGSDERGGTQVEILTHSMGRPAQSTRLCRLVCCLLFDHLGGTQQRRRRHLDAERLRGLEIEHHLDAGGLLYRQVAGFSPLRMRPV